MKISSNLVGDSNDENKLLLTNTQISKLRKAFANNSSVNIKLLKTPLYKIRRIFRKTFEPLLKAGLPLIGNVLKTLAKSVLMPLEITAVASATDAVIDKKCLDLVIQH